MAVFVGTLSPPTTPASAWKGIQDVVGPAKIETKR